VAGLHQQDIPASDAAEVGLLNDRGREVIRGRITVPIIRDGQVLSMVGRAISAGLQRRYLELSLPPHALCADLVGGQRRVVLVEGVTDYLVALEWRVPAITAMGRTPHRTCGPRFAMPPLPQRSSRSRWTTTRPAARPAQPGWHGSGRSWHRSDGRTA
jgi:hypothetical protein